MKNILPFFLGALAITVIFGTALPLIIFFFALPYLIKTYGSKSNFGLDNFVNQFNQTRGQVGRKTVKNNSNSNLPNFNNFNFKSNFMETLNFKKVISIVAILAFALIVLDGIVNVPAGHTAVIFDRGRGVLEQPLGEGIHLKIPFWQKSTVMSTRIESYTMSAGSGEGDVYGDDAIDALTKDGQQIQLDMTVQYHLEKKDAPGLYQTIGLNYISKIVRPGARSISREVITAYNSKELFQNETRQSVQSQIESKMKSYLEGKGLNLDGVLVRNIKFSNVYLSAIEEKQIAEQKIQKAEFEKQEAVIRKEKKIIEAEAEAEAIKLKGQALKANSEIIQLEMINKLSPNIKWGILPDSVMPLLDLKNIIK